MSCSYMDGHLWPVTLDIMSKLQHAIKHTNLLLRQKRIVWFTATLCLLGSFRIHKVLPVHSHLFDKTTTLAAEDVTLTSSTHDGTETCTLSYHTKDPKEDKSKHRICVDVFENVGALNWVYAVKAYGKYLFNIGTLEPNQALLTLHDGAGYTGRMFNDGIKTLLTG